jgi:hypothetical protein
MKTQIAFAILLLSALTLDAQQAKTIRQIDFDNFRYPWNDSQEVPSTWSWLTSAPDSHIATVDGIYRFHSPDDDNEPSQSPAVSVDSVAYGDLDGDGVEEAVVALNYTSGGTANEDYLYVYRFHAGHAELLARMQTGSRADGGLIRTFVRHGLLVVDFADADKQVGACCSEGYIRVQYRWQDGAFIEEGERGYGKLDLDEGARPRFRDYRVKTIYLGEPAAPIITQEVLAFRTRIRDGATHDVEFAGHYTIPRWGCGAGCNTFMIVDSKSGKVYDGFGVADLPFEWVKEHGGEDVLPRMEFYPNSRLLQINGCPNEEDCGLYDYEMIEGKGLKPIRIELLPKEALAPQKP